MDENLPDLGDLERDVMQLVWADGPVTAESVRERLARRLKESTVRTVLRRLEEKGYVSHTVDWFCNGSVEEVLVGMVDTAMLDRKRLRMLTDRVARAKGKK